MCRPATAQDAYRLNLSVSLNLPEFFGNYQLEESDPPLTGGEPCHSRGFHASLENGARVVRLFSLSRSDHPIDTPCRIAFPIDTTITAGRGCSRVSRSVLLTGDNQQRRYYSTAYGEISPAATSTRVHSPAPGRRFSEATTTALLSQKPALGTPAWGTLRCLTPGDKAR